MVVHRETDLVAFARRAAPYLVEREAQHNIMLGLLAVLQARPPEVAPYLAWVEQGGQMVGVAMRTPPYRLLLAHGMEAAAIEAVAHDLHHTRDSLPGVLSGGREAAEFAALWSELSGLTARLTVQHRLYMLEQVRPLPFVAGEMRDATAADRELLTDWWKAFGDEALEPTTREQAARGVASRLHNDPLVTGLRLWAVEGAPVSFAGYTGPTPNSIRVGPVYTPPEQRGKGYASALVAALSCELLNRGYRYTTLYTDVFNPTSNKIYQAIGYEPLTDSHEYTFAPAQESAK